MLDAGLNSPFIPECSPIPLRHDIALYSSSDVALAGPIPDINIGSERIHERQPARNKPTDDEFFTYDAAEEKKPNHEFLKSHFFREGRLTEEQALYILEHATKIFSTEANMVPVKSPVTSAQLFALVFSDP